MVDNKLLCSNCGCNFDSFSDISDNSSCPFCGISLLKQIEEARNNGLKQAQIEKQIQLEQVQVEEQACLEYERAQTEIDRRRQDRRNAPEQVATTVKGGRWWVGSLFTTGTYPGTIMLSNTRIVYKSSLGSLPKRDCEIYLSSIEKAKILNGFTPLIFANVKLNIKDQNEESFEFLFNKGSERTFLDALYDYIDIEGYA